MSYNLKLRICKKCNASYTSDSSKNKYCPQCQEEMRFAKTEALWEIRPLTIDTPFLCYKWHKEGDSIEKIAEIVRRPRKQVIEAIKIYEKQIQINS